MSFLTKRQKTLDFFFVLRYNNLQIFFKKRGDLVKLRRLTAFLLTLLLACGAMAFFNGCKKSDPNLVYSHEIDRADQKYMRYQTFSGEKNYTAILPDSVKVIVCEIKTDSGELEIEILRQSEVAEEADLLVFRDSTEQDLEKEILLTRGGTYFIRLTAKEHCGSYSFTWK